MHWFPFNKQAFLIDDLMSYISSSQMTWWAMAKSPFMFGGDVRNLDASTYSLITNPTLLEINSFSSNNKEARKPVLF